MAKRKPRKIRPREKNVPRGYDSKWEYELHRNIFKNWNYHADYIEYIINYTNLLEDIDYNKVKYIEVYDDKTHGGANLKYKGKVTSIGSDDGKGGVVVSAKDEKKTINIVSANGSVQVTVIDSNGHEEYKFTTNIQPIHDVEEEELRIINSIESLE